MTIKTQKVEARVTDYIKMKIAEQCCEYDLTESDVIRLALVMFLEKEVKK